MRILTISSILVSGLGLASAQTPAPAPVKKAAPATPTAKPAAAAPAMQKKTTTPAAPAASAPKPAAKADANDPVVVSIDGQAMTKSQFEAWAALLPDNMRTAATGPAKRKFIDQYVEMEVMAVEARRRKLYETPASKALVALQTDQALASELYRHMSDTLKVDDAAVKAYYDQHKNEYETVKASHILIRFKGSPVPVRPGMQDMTEEESLAKAKDLKDKIAKGAKFADLAKAESDDTGSGANGGELGSFSHGQMVPPFEEAAFKLPAGQVSDPVKTQFGYHIIKVDEHTNKSFEDVKPQIEARLKPELAKKAVEEVKKTVPVTINDEYFGK